MTSTADADLAGRLAGVLGADGIAARLVGRDDPIHVAGDRCAAGKVHVRDGRLI